MFLVEAKDRAVPVGFFMFFAGIAQRSGDDSHPAEVRVGYVLAESAWGQGYASELLCGFVAQWDARRPAARLLAGVDRDNAASRRVLEKAGFQLASSKADVLEYARE